MLLILHRKVHWDIDAIMEHDERVADRELADEFHAELRRFMLVAADRPESFSIRERDLRRVNLRRFPCHFFFASSAMRCGFLSYVITEGVRPWASTADEPTPPEKLDAQAVDSQRPVPLQFLAPLPRRRGGWFASPALQAQGLPASRSSVAVATVASREPGRGAWFVRPLCPASCVNA